MVNKLDDEMKLNICSSAIDKFGIKSQIDMAIEEMSELTQALSKFKRNKPNNVEEEIADVIIMIEQLCLMFNNEQIRQIIEEKYLRLERRINDLH